MDAKDNLGHTEDEFLRRCSACGGDIEKPCTLEFERRCTHCHGDWIRIQVGKPCGKCKEGVERYTVKCPGDGEMHWPFHLREDGLLSWTAGESAEESRDPASPCIFS